MAPGSDVLRRTPACIVLAIFAPVVSAACGPPRATSALARSRAAGALRWGGDVQGSEPYVYEDPTRPGHLVGFEAELAEALAKELGVRAEFVQSDWSNLVPLLDRGVFDVAMNGLEVTDARIGRVTFTRPYYVFSQRLMVRADNAAIDASPDLASLRGKRVGTLEPYADLVAGRTDAVLLDDIIAARYGMTRPELRVVGDVGLGYYAIGARPADADLAVAIDDALGAPARRGDLERILQKRGLWNARQAPLLTWSAADRARMLREPPPPPRLGAGQVALFLKGALVTLAVSALAMMLLAIPLGLGLALARLYGGRLARAAAATYVDVYRGTPVLLQLYVLYFGIAPPVERAIAGVLGAFGSTRAPTVPAFAFAVAVVGLGMNYAAYEAEVYRAAIQAVPTAQTEAGLALGMTLRRVLRRVVLPQALRFAIPNVTNDFIALLKDSSLVSVITVVELTKQMTITAVDVRSWIGPSLVCAALYFAMSHPLGIIARRVELRLSGERGEREISNQSGSASTSARYSTTSRFVSSTARSRPSSVPRAEESPLSSAASTVSSASTRAGSSLVPVESARARTGVARRARSGGRSSTYAGKVGMVFQQFGLFAHMTALENVCEAPIQVLGSSREAARLRAVGLLERVGVGHRQGAYPRELSGGEQQRVAIARALAMQPEALLLDEPTSALDPERKSEVIALLESFAADGTTLVMVSHEPAVVRDLCDRVVVLRGGKVAADGAPATVLKDV